MTVNVQRSLIDQKRRSSQDGHHTHHLKLQMKTMKSEDISLKAPAKIKQGFTQQKAMTQKD